MQILFLITFILGFLPNLYFGKDTLAIPIYSCFFGLYLFLCFFLKPGFTLSKILLLTKSKAFSMFMLFVTAVIISIFISGIKGTFFLQGFLLSFFGGLILTVLLIYLGVFIGVPQIIDYKRIIKITLIIFFVLFVLGIIQFSCLYFQIEPITKMFHLLSNRRMLIGGYFDTSTRIYTAFQEPSLLGYFIILVCPIVYSICYSKVTLFKSTLTDIIIKQLTFSLMVLNLVLAQSPPFFLLGVIILIVFFVCKTLKSSENALSLAFIINMVVIITISTIFLGNFYSKKDVISTLQKTFVNRIINEVENFNNPDYLTEGGSFTTRIILFINAYEIFKKNPLIGVGYGNMTKVMINQLRQSPILLNWELAQYFEKVGQEDPATGASSAIFYRSLAEVGIIGTVFLYLFFLSLIVSIDKSLKKFDGIEKDFLIGSKFFLLLIMLTSFYTSFLHMSYIWIFIGLTHSLLLNKSKRLNQVEELIKEND